MRDEPLFRIAVFENGIRHIGANQSSRNRIKADVLLTVFDRGDFDGVVDACTGSCINGKTRALEAEP